MSSVFKGKERTNTRCPKLRWLLVLTRTWNFACAKTPDLQCNTESSSIQTHFYEVLIIYRTRLA